MNITDMISRGVLGEPAFLLGFIAFIGLILQKHSFDRIIHGTIRTVMGYILIQIGASAAGVSLGNLSSLIQRGFQVIGIIPHNEVIVALAQINYGNYIAWIMLFGMIFHLLLARLSPIKYVFLTGHHILFMASMLAALLGTYPLEKWQVILIGSVFLGMSMSIGPAIIQPYVRKVTKSDDIAVGHFNSFGFLLAGFIASFFKVDKDVKEEKLPKFIYKIQTFFQDHIISTTIFMVSLFLMASLFAGRSNVEELFFGRSPWIVSVIQGVWFAAGVYVILMGVRMLLSEIVPAFHGISEKLVPNAVIALDCPILFPYAPLAAMFGFLFSLLGGLVAMLIFVALPNQYTIIIPGIVAHFFAGGASGVIAYTIGRKRGLVVAALVHGFVISILPYYLFQILTGLGYVRATFADTDFAVWGFIVKWFIEFVLGL